MATISKFYLHDAVSPNLGIMPSAALGTTGSATGAATARDATDVIGTSQKSSTITSNADINSQSWGHRRFVTRPLAAQTLPGTGVWTFSYARDEANLNHNQAIRIQNLYAWRPSTGANLGSFTGTLLGTEPTVAGAQQAEAVTAAASSLAILDGDILVFDIITIFTQAMSTAYTEDFFYDGTTEASATSCASFISSPAPLTLFLTSDPTEMFQQRRRTSRRRVISVRS